MNSISLIAVDLDGTLLTSQRKLAPQGATLLRRASRQGIHVVLASVRNPDTVRAFCVEMDLHAPLICTNGAQVLGSPDGPLWASRTLPREAALEIAEYADRCGWELMTTVGPTTYFRRRPGQELGPIAPNRVVVSSNREAVQGDPLRILAFQADAVAGLAGLCASHLSQVCHVEVLHTPTGQAESLGIFSKGADKGTALRLVLDRLEIPAAQVMAIGDNTVDLGMFALAGISVAMGNAPPEVKRLATAVAPTHDQEGVAWAVQTYLEGLVSYQNEY